MYSGTKSRAATVDEKAGEISICATMGCGYVCCTFQRNNYIVCYPGELQDAESEGWSLSHLEVIDTDPHDGAKVICNAKDTATCDRGYKPLDCKSYPFFPTGAAGELDALVKGRKCPLRAGQIEAHREWVVRTWASLASRRPRVADWLPNVSLVGYDDIRRIPSAPPRDPIVRRINPRLVAVCGIDGAGKSTVLGELVKGVLNPRLIPIAKKERPNVGNLVSQYGEAFGSVSDVLLGDYAVATRYAHAFDFLNYYESEYAPHRFEEGHVVSDRWWICSVAYADAGTALGETMYRMFEPLDEPGLTIYLDIEPALALQRIRKRGRPNLDEDLGVLEAYRGAYETWLPRLRGEVVRIDAAGDDEPIRNACRAAVEYAACTNLDEDEQ